MTTEQLGLAAEFFGLFIIVATLVYLTLRLSRSAVYRLAVGVALTGALFLFWVNLAVGVVGEPENPVNLVYFGVLAIGAVGAILVRIRPPGMARVMFSMAITQTLVAAFTLVAKLGQPVTPALSLMIFNSILIAFWVGSALLFRKAGREQASAGNGGGAAMPEGH
jgi:hypothetical protein